MPRAELGCLQWTCCFLMLLTSEGPPEPRVGSSSYGGRLVGLCLSQLDCWVLWCCLSRWGGGVGFVTDTPPTWLSATLPLCLCPPESHLLFPVHALSDHPPQSLLPVLSSQRGLAHEAAHCSDRAWALGVTKPHTPLTSWVPDKPSNLSVSRGQSLLCRLTWGSGYFLVGGGHSDVTIAAGWTGKSREAVSWPSHQQWLTACYWASYLLL